MIDGSREAALPRGYTPIKSLGEGSNGVVFQAHHQHEGIVAVKVLSPEVSADPTASERFRREIEAYLEINHPNVVSGKRLIEDRERDILALVMEYVPGHDLRVRLERGEPLPVLEALGLLVQLCDGLEAVHRRGIIHRDIKPENLIINPVGLLKVTDFGIACLPGTSRLTDHGGVVGTMQYASPEYLISSEVHPRGDIYALGLIAYEMLTGRPPFEGGDFYSAISRRIQSDPPSPSGENPLIPPWLEDVVLTASARNPEHRYQSISEVKKALTRGIRRENLPISSGSLTLRGSLAMPRSTASPSGVRRRSLRPLDGQKRDALGHPQGSTNSESRTATESAAPLVSPQHAPTHPSATRPMPSRPTPTRPAPTERGRPAVTASFTRRDSPFNAESLLTPPEGPSSPSWVPTVDTIVRFIGSSAIGATIGYQLLQNLFAR